MGKRLASEYCGYPRLIRREDLRDFLTSFLPVEGWEHLPERLEWTCPELMSEVPGCNLSGDRRGLRFFPDPDHLFLGAYHVDPDPEATFRVFFPSGLVDTVLVAVGRRYQGGVHRTRLRLNGAPLGSWLTPARYAEKGAFALVLAAFWRRDLRLPFRRPAHSHRRLSPGLEAQSSNSSSSTSSRSASSGGSHV